MGAPAGLGQQDSWWRYDAKTLPDGSIERTLNVGGATLVVPEGTPVPQGAHAIYYDGTLEGRDQAVAQHFESHGVALQNIGAWGWNNDINAHDAWRKEVAATHFPDARHIHLGGHTGSLDDKVESIFHSGLGAQSFADQCALFAHDKSEYYREASTGVDLRHIDRIDSSYAQAKEHLQQIQSQANPSARPFYQHLETRVHTLYEGAQNTQKDIEQMQAQKDARYEQLRDSFSDLPYKGPVYVANAIEDIENKSFQTMRAKDFCENLVYASPQEAIAPSALVWMEGMSQWQPIAQEPSLGALYHQARGSHASPPPPLPSTSQESSQESSPLDFKNMDILAKLQQYREDKSAIPTTPKIHKAPTLG